MFSSCLHLRCRHFVVLACALLLSVGALAGEKDVGIVMLHGKWARPPINLAGLVSELQGQGYKVVLPIMPWSSLREYDVPYEKALDEIDAAAATLRAQGASRIVIAGLSIGANAALAYASRGRAFDALVILSPGHTPEQGAFQQRLQGSVSKARQMVAAGEGLEKTSFDDVNQGRFKTVQVSAQSYLSYFAPEGLGSMTQSVSALTKSMPVFVGVGTGDGIQNFAKDTLFARLPKNEKNSYITVSAGHTGLTDVIGSPLMAWLRSLNF